MNMNIKKTQGFTLIELMIVVAIIAILAAIALPAYQDYVARAQVSEAATLTGGVKTAIAEEYANTGDFDGITNATAGLASAISITGKYVLSVTVTDGLVEAEMGKAASQKVTGGTLAYSPWDEGGSVSWNCAVTETDIEPKYLPSVCRQ